MSNKTFSGILGDQKCECADSLCHAHIGKSDCQNTAACILFRVDMVDNTGTAFCEQCTDDAMESGLFTDSFDDCDDEENEAEVL